MSKGQRFDETPKLNIKKVIATLLILALIIVAIYFITHPVKKTVEVTKNVSNSYILVYMDGKWGVLNSKGENILTPSYENMIIIPNNTKPVFLITQNVNYEDGTYTSYAINNTGTKLFPGYEKVEAIQNIKADGSVFYQENTLITLKDGKYGLINLEGTELLPCNYDKITPIKGIENSFITEKDGKFGVVDNSGSVIVDNQYAEITALTDRYEDGYIVKDIDGKYGLFNYNKQQVLECKYEEIFHMLGNNIYIVKENGTYEVVDSDGLITLTLEDLKDAVAVDHDFITLKKGDEYSVIYKDGSGKIAGYSYLKYIIDDCFIAKKDDSYGIVDTEGNIKVDFSYKKIVYMKKEGFIEADRADGKTDLLTSKFELKANGIVSEINSKYGYIKVRENSEYRYYDFSLTPKTQQELMKSDTLFLKKNGGKYGYVDKDGKVVVDYIYDDATDQNEYGYCGVKKDGKWGSIDSTGKVVLEPSLTLENNLVISFLGNLHLAPDLNAYYFTNVKE